MDNSKKQKSKDLIDRLKDKISKYRELTERSRRTNDQAVYRLIVKDLEELIKQYEL